MAGFLSQKKNKMAKKNIIPSDVRIGHLIRFKKQTLKVALSEDGCRGCIFQSEAGARFCTHSSSCFAHLRPDHKSVKFIYKET